MARAALFALVCLRAACLQRPSSLTAAPGPAIAASAGASDDESLTLLYDSKCWACQWEVDHLTSNGADMDFVDIEADDYDGVVSYADGMRSIRAVRGDGEVLTGPAAFRAAYARARPTALGAFWALGETPPLRPLVDGGYAAFAALRPWLTRGASVEALAAAAATDRARRVVAACARDRDVSGGAVADALDALRAARPCPPTTASFAGRWELVWTSSLARVPFLGGYMPNRELLTWDLERGRLDLEVEILPVLPKLAIVGERLEFADSTLTYVVGEGKPPSSWAVFHADGDVVCADSSVTGTNVIRRVGPD